MQPGKEFFTQTHATDLQALEFQRLESFSDHDLGTAAADVADQAPPGTDRHGVRHT